MSDTYQAVYDAVRSRFHGCDVGSAIENALRNENIGHHVSMATDRIMQSFTEYERPFVTLRPKMFPDGKQWCALYGENLQEGIAGFGDTPSAAAYDFDKNWHGQKLKPSTGVNNG